MRTQYVTWECSFSKIFLSWKCMFLIINIGFRDYRYSCKIFDKKYQIWDVFLEPAMHYTKNNVILTVSQFSLCSGPASPCLTPRKDLQCFPQKRDLFLVIEKIWSKTLEFLNEVQLIDPYQFRRLTSTQDLSYVIFESFFLDTHLTIEFISFSSLYIEKHLLITDALIVQIQKLTCVFEINWNYVWRKKASNLIS